MHFFMPRQDTCAFAQKQYPLWFQRKSKRAVRVPLGFHHNDFFLAKGYPVAISHDPVHIKSGLGNNKLLFAAEFSAGIFAEGVDRIDRFRIAEHFMGITGANRDRIRPGLPHKRKRTQVVKMAMRQQHIVKLSLS